MLSGEYSNLTKMLGGKVIKIEQGKPAGINPFELEADYKGKEKFLNILDKAEKEIGFVTRKLQNTNRNTSYVWWRFCFYCNKISV